MGVVDEMIRVLDPRRDTGGCGVVYSLGLRLINTFFTYLCLHPIFILVAYLCCLLLLSVYTVGFCKAIQYEEDDSISRTKSQIYQRIRTKRRYQKGK